MFHGNEFKNTSYVLPQDLLDKYDSGALTLHELVNKLFELWEQVDESQHSLLAVALQAVHLPICRGTITRRTNSEDRN